MLKLSRTASTALLGRSSRGLPRTARTTALGLLLCFGGSLASLTPLLAAAELQFKQADAAVARFMEAHQVHAATLALSRAGQLLHERAFGFAEPQLLTPLTPLVRMRIASISKPITAAALKRLVREGKLKLGDPVLKYLPQPRYAQPADQRWRGITLGEVLQHMGGWDRSVSGDPMFKDRAIMKDLRTNSLAPGDVVRWMMTQPLDFDPGTRSAYSNFGYCLLGVIIEECTGRSYEDVVKSGVAREAGMTTLTFSSSRPELRDRNEIWYDFGSEGEHFLIEPMQAHGGWVCTAADLARFLDKFWINGEPRTGGHGSWVFYGSLPGTTAVAVQRADGLNYALLMNKRDPGSNWHEELRAALDAALK